MTLYSSINGNPIQQLSWTIPTYGAWTCDVSITDLRTPLEGQVSVKVADLTMLGTIVRGGDFTGATHYRVVGGYGGWRQQVPPTFYRNPFGLRLSVPINDVAKQVNERVEIQTDVKIGAFYMRSQAPASRVLWQLSPKWWIRSDGVTVLSDRLQSNIVSNYVVVDAALGVGRITVQTENPKDWVPGAFFEAITLPQRYRISVVRHRLQPNRLLTDVWTG